MKTPIYHGGVHQRRIDVSTDATPIAGVPYFMYAVVGFVLFPIYWLLGALLGAPGMRFRWSCLSAGLWLLIRGHFKEAYRCMVFPMDSVRHFEMEFFWNRMRTQQPERVLDISSPRLINLIHLKVNRKSSVDLLNPDTKDLERTRKMAHGLGVLDRCQFLDVLVEDLPDDARDYSLVTCMSVLEHIVDDESALRAMWERVAPGGCLLLSIPCASQMMEEFSNVDEYELLVPDETGFVFWQRYYDYARLQTLFSITGQPVAFEFYAERTKGAYDADVYAKRTDKFYPFWREPYATAMNYTRCQCIENMPGMGVVALEFTKSKLKI